MYLIIFLQQLLDKTRALDFLAPLLLRLYLAPIFWIAGTNKLDGFLPDANTVAWFGNPDWGLGMPLPWLMTFLAAYSEVLGAIALLLGLAVRWMSIPLLTTMLVAVLTVHWKNGWQAIADSTMCLFNCEAAEAAAVRLDKAREILREHANYQWLTEEGSFVVLNNGIEFAATYFIMLLVLFFIGAGRYLSIDYWLARRYLHLRQ
ncbi:MAG: DoxX family protein [Gammaproteobacteria bacterium]